MRRTLILALILAAGSLAGCASAPPVPVTQETAAVVQGKAIGFHYQARRSQYTCAGLAQKLSTILRAVGVRETRPMDMGCTSNVTISRASIHIHAAALIDASPSNLAAAVRYSPSDRLLARIESRELPTAAEVPQVRAAWTAVRLATLSTPGLDSGDCELLEAFRDQLAPALGLRMLNSSLSCDSASAGRFQQSLSVVALLPVEPL